MAKKQPPADDAGIAAATGERSGIRLADHPRAARSIPRIRAWGALIGFAVAAWYGNKLGLPFADLVVRSIVFGMAGSVVAWAAAQAVWRQIVYAELAAARRQAAEAQQAVLDELEEVSRGNEPGAR